jgi:sulfatase modifying factor 1
MTIRLLYIPLLFLFACSGTSEKNQPQVKKVTEKINPVLEEKSGAVSDSAGLVKDLDGDSEGQMILITGGVLQMGSENGLPNEMPVHDVEVNSFYIDKSPVTVAKFREFVKATGFKTEAEKFGDSGVYNFDIKNWELLKGAYWEKPFGPSGLLAENNHPVTHISWNDAVAYAKWAGKRLPNEAEWEFAARSGKNSGSRFSWGDDLVKNGKYFANTWQWEINTPDVKDGFLYTSPVGAFGENDAGLTDMGGNVWNWCADNYKSYPGNSEPVREDPMIKVIRGGSFFFDQLGEQSLTVSFRSKNSHETSLFNTGFRCAKDNQ